ncbi:MAG: hypothetical protein JXJ04_17045 [Spirochaetales bacterium]|nr:hypothetical protein [Spirochaetales bacterium]
MNKKFVLFIILVFLSFIAVTLTADESTSTRLSLPDESEISLERTIDWWNGILHVKIVKQNDIKQNFTPDNKYLVERYIREKLPDIFLNSVLDIYVDSAHTIRDLVIEKADSIRSLKNFYIYGLHEGAYQSQDFKQTFVYYSFPVYSEKGIISLFLHHDYPEPLNKEIGFIPTMEYTGLIIYAKGTYLSYGTNKRVSVEPALFPVLYDEETNIVLDKWMCDPGYLKKWGMVAYAETTGESEFIKRTGLYPLKTMAHQVFGKNNCDLTLSNEVVKKLLTSEKNRKMLQQGRILIIIDPQQ